ncbi:hypothetical protein [Methylobacterium sp. R2-1]|uniref:hypothetical protein n=1 Tax=Methylobacterium sp. R2-1 TaxID=2587064 RepID=UPI0016182534|nr:hypothetical protein [Methylobacterium sp. R2-1]MBB2964733.1 hypothetical protein [Methylobacterium sp. R2-1]
MQHRVIVWQKPYMISTAQRSKSVWIASGDYEGQSIQTQDRTEGAAIKRWCEAARYRGN